MWNTCEDYGMIAEFYIEGLLEIQVESFAINKCAEVYQRNKFKRDALIFMDTYAALKILTASKN